MKKIIILVTILLITKSFGQNIAYMETGNSCNSCSSNAIDTGILKELREEGLNIQRINNTELFKIYNNSISNLNDAQINDLKLFNKDYIILHNKTIQGSHPYSASSDDNYVYQNKILKYEFVVINVNTNKSKLVSLYISTYQGRCNDLKSCSDIMKFVEEVKNFIQADNSSKSTDEEVVKNITETKEPDNPSFTKTKKKSFFGVSGNSEEKYKLVRAKERNLSTNIPILVDVYDKSLQLKTGDNIIITRTDEVKIPGERKTVKSETTIGKAKITEDFNKPLYTAKLIGTAGNNLKDYKDGDENYSVVKGEDNKEIVSVPKVMVIPEQIDQNKLVNGEYQLTIEEALLIGALKNKLENNKFMTIGFDSAIKALYQDQILNENTQLDIKSKILEASKADFYVEFKSIYDNSSLNYTTKIILSDGGTITKTNEIIEDRPKWITSSGKVYKQLNKNEAKELVWSNLDNVIYLFDQSRNLMFAIHENGNGMIFKLNLGQNSNYTDTGLTGKVTKPTLPCIQNFNFKIRNYATSEDVASDIRQLNTCGTPDDYKFFAQAILNDGAINKINKEFKDVLENGKKINVNFTILNSSYASFDKTYNGMRLEEYIQNAVQTYSINYRQNGVVNKRMSFSEVYIPSINENTGQNNYPNDFALSIIKYLKDVAGVECEKSVIGQNVNFNVK